MLRVNAIEEGKNADDLLGPLLKVFRLKLNIA